MMRGWLHRLLSQPPAPLPSMLADIDTRPEVVSRHGLAGLVARHPLLPAVLCGTLLAGVALLPLDRLLARAMPAPPSGTIDTHDYARMGDLRHCFARIDKDNWAMREQCQTAGSAVDAADRQGDER